ncbi:hypothetical protein ACP4OV_014138 [Aristida adscensionis]
MVRTLRRSIHAVQRRRRGDSEKSWPSAARSRGSLASL